MEINRSWLSIPVLSLVLISPTSAQVDTPPSSKAAITVSDLDAIMQEEILLKALANRARQRAELGRFDSEVEAAGLSRPSVPRLAWRRSTASGWLARFILADGASVIASTGEQLPGGYTVAQINDTGVKLKRDGDLIDLTAASSGTSTPQASSSSARPIK